MASEEAKITDYFAEVSGLDNKDFPIGIGDDMAMMNFGESNSALITTDMLLDGSHFDTNVHSFEGIGYKSMAVNLSDCASMASVPFAAVVSVGLPKGFGSDNLKKLHKGIVEAGRKFGCALIGGDITSWQSGEGKLAISVAMLSKPGNAEPVQRTTAKVGDVVCVTGELGGSLAGRHMNFTPRVKEALRLTEIAKINSMMDISDGLSTDLNHLCRLSKVGAMVDADMIPVSEAAKKAVDPLEAALNDGEDFELLFTLSESEYEKVVAGWDLDTAITKVGVITEKDVLIRLGDGSECELAIGGYDHLRG